MGKMNDVKLFSPQKVKIVKKAEKMLLKLTDPCECHFSAQLLCLVLWSSPFFIKFQNLLYISPSFFLSVLFWRDKASSPVCTLRTNCSFNTCELWKSSVLLFRGTFYFMFLQHWAVKPWLKRKYYPELQNLYFYAACFTQL